MAFSSLFLLVALVTLKAKSSPSDSQQLSSSKEGNYTSLNATLPSLGRYLTLSNKDQGYVTGGGLVSFDSQLEAQEKSDVLDSLLFAELSASDVYDKTQSFSLWYRLYIDVLQETGWTIASQGFKPYNPATDTPFTLVGKIWDFLSPLCRPAQQRVFKKLLDVWDDLADYDHRVLSFLTASGTGAQETKAANFQVTPATRGNPGEVFIVFGGFYYQSLTAVQRFLTYFWPSHAISLYHSVEVAKFKSESYTPIRRRVQESLGNRAANLVHMIEL